MTRQLQLLIILTLAACVAAVAFGSFKNPDAFRGTPRHRVPMIAR